MKFYHVDKLDFWSVYCWLVPVFMITLGVYTFLVCIFGFFTSGSENRAMIGGYAVLLALAFLAQLASIFMAMELRTEVNKNITPTSEIISELNKVRFLNRFLKDESSYRLPGILRSGFIVLYKLYVVYWKSYIFLKDFLRQNMPLNRSNLLCFALTLLDGSNPLCFSTFSTIFNPLCSILISFTYSLPQIRKNFLLMIQ